MATNQTRGEAARGVGRDLTQPDDKRIGGEMGGASDGNSGGGSGAGIPDGDTALRAGDAATRGDVHRDRDKLFPEARTHEPHPADRESAKEEGRQ
jgi:hypothetical protein